MTMMKQAESLHNTAEREEITGRQPMETGGD
jgi:hypothetical protein